MYSYMQHVHDCIVPEWYLHNLAENNNLLLYLLLHLCGGWTCVCTLQALAPLPARVTVEATAIVEISGATTLVFHAVRIMTCFVVSKHPEFVPFEYTPLPPLSTSCDNIPLEQWLINLFADVLSWSSSAYSTPTCLTRICIWHRIKALFLFLTLCSFKHKYHDKHHEDNNHYHHHIWHNKTHHDHGCWKYHSYHFNYHGTWQHHSKYKRFALYYNLYWNAMVPMGQISWRWLVV